jgi:hypothetical protein
VLEYGRVKNVCWPSSVDPVKKRVDLSLRLSQVDPQAAKKLRMKKKDQKKKKKQTTKLTSDGESAEQEER